MARIDLIPASWRERRRVRQVLRSFIAGLGTIGVLTAVAQLFVAGKMIEAEFREARLTAEKQAMDLAMNADRTAYERLKSLRRMAERMEKNRAFSLVETVLSPLDADLSDGVTLDSLVATVSERSEDSAHVALHGVARSAGQLKEFSERMAARPNWRRLKIVHVAPANEGSGIEFALEIDAVTVPAGETK